MASRASRRAEKLKAEQNLGDPTDAVRRQLAQAERTRRNYSQGAEGERMVSQVLGSLERYGWVALHDLRWPGRQRANIDHIAVGPGGVVIIDTKHWTGDVVLTATELSQNGYSRSGQLGSVVDASNAVAALLLPQHRLAVSAVLALAAQDEEPVRIAGTTVVGRAHLPTLLATMPPNFSPFDVADVARSLQSTLGAPLTPAETSAIATASTSSPRPRARKNNRRRSPATAPHRPPTSARRAPKQASQPVRCRKKQQSTSGSGFISALVLFGAAIWWISRILG